MKKLISIVIVLASFIAHAAEKNVAKESASTKISDESVYQLKSKWLNQEGQSIALDAYKGAPVVISMVYLSCHYSCPLTINFMKDVEKKLNEQQKKQVRFVLVSFDPSHDTPEKMKKYAKDHKLDLSRWSFITTGKDADIRELAGVLDFKYKQTADGEFDHSLALIALDAEGVVRSRIEGTSMKIDTLTTELQKSMK